MSSIKKTPGAGSAFKNAQLNDAQQTKQAKQPAVDAKQVQKQAIAEFAQRTAQDPELGQVAAQMGADGKLTDADGQPLKGSALLQARLDAMKQAKEPPQPSVNPFPDTTRTEEPPQPSVNPFPDTGGTVEEPPQPSVNPFPDTGGEVPTEPVPTEPAGPTEPLTTEPAEPTVNPFPDTTPAPGPEIAINPIPDGRVPDVDDDES